MALLLIKLIEKHGVKCEPNRLSNTPLISKCFFQLSLDQSDNRR